MAVAAFPIEKDECLKCYTLWYDEEGVNTCLDCGKCFCNEHAMEHTKSKGHPYFIHFDNPQASQFRFFDDQGFTPAELPPEYIQIVKIIKAQPFLYENPRGGDDAQFPMPMLSGFYSDNWGRTRSIESGNTSYLNAILHTIFSMEEFSSFFVGSECERGDYQDLGQQFFRFVSELRRGNRKTMRPRLLHRSIGRLDKRFRDNQPKDAMEFLKFLLHTFHLRMKGAPMNLITFDISWTVLCNNCCYVETGIDKNQQILTIYPQLDIQQTQWAGIEDLIDRSMLFTVSNRKCPKCGGELTCSRSITKAPQYLFIHVALDNSGHKIDLHLELDPDNLNLAQHVISSSDQLAVYKLNAFTSHSGKTANWGRNSAYVKYNQQWYKFYDESVLACDRDHNFKFGKQYLYLYKLRQ